MLLAGDIIEAVLNHARAGGMHHLTVQSGTRSLPVYQRLGFAQSARLLQLDL